MSVHHRTVVICQGTRRGLVKAVEASPKSASYIIDLALCSEPNLEFWEGVAQLRDGLIYLENGKQVAFAAPRVWVLTPHSPPEKIILRDYWTIWEMEKGSLSITPQNELIAKLPKSLSNMRKKTRKRRESEASTASSSSSSSASGKRGRRSSARRRDASPTGHAAETEDDSDE